MQASPSPDSFCLSGTSLAAPYVSGAAALLLQKNPSLTPDQVKARLMKTADKLPATTTVSVDPVTGIQYVSENDIFTVGAGYLDVPAALSSTDLSTAPAVSPAVSFDASTKTVTLVLGSNAVWGTNAVWDTNAVWGPTQFGERTPCGVQERCGEPACWGRLTPFGGRTQCGEPMPYGVPAAAWTAPLIR
jgi:serine protease AprX